jgi:hypothetical protein
VAVADEAVVAAAVVAAAAAAFERHAGLFVVLQNVSACWSLLSIKPNTLYKLNELQDLIKLLTVFCCVTLSTKLLCSLR